MRLLCGLQRVLLGRGRRLLVRTLQGARCSFDGADQVLLGQPGVEDIHGAHLAELRHRLAIDPHRPHRGGPAVCLGEAIVAGGDREARRHALHVVFEGARKRLVEVVQVEEQLPLRRCERTEVREVRVAAELHVEPSSGCVLQVRGHDLRRAPVERERRNHHAPVAHRHEISLTRGVLLLEQRNRVPAIRRGLPAGMTGRRYSLARGFPTRLALVDTQMLDLLHRLPPSTGPTARPVPTAVDGVDPANTLPRPSWSTHHPECMIRGRGRSSVRADTSGSRRRVRSAVRSASPRRRAPGSGGRHRGGSPRTSSGASRAAGRARR